MKKLIASLLAAVALNAGADGFFVGGSAGGGAGGAGTVTSVSVTTANGVSGTVATPTTTPAISLTLGAITPSTVTTGTVTTSVINGTPTITSPTLVTPTLGAATATTINKVTLTQPATGSTLTILNGKTLTANNSLTLAGTDSTTMTFPTTSATIARTDAANTFSGTQTFSGALTFTPANSSATLSPTGSGTVSVNPSTAGTINNMAIGGTTATTANFTTLTATGQTSLGGAAAAEGLRVLNTASAVNRVDVQGATTGNAPYIAANGTDANISLAIKSVGTGGVYLQPRGLNSLVGVANASAVNYVTVTGTATGNAPYIQAAGSDTNVDLILKSQGTGGIILSPNGATSLYVVSNTSAVNYLTTTASTTGNPLQIATGGSDTNRGIIIDSAGTGTISLRPNASAVLVASSTGTAVTGTLSASSHVTFEGVTSTGATGTGKIVFDTSPTFTTSAISPLFRSTAAKVLLQGTGSGATQLATTQTTAPTCSSNCGTSPSVAGTDTAGIVTMGASGSPASGWVVTFNGTWASAPACNVQSALSTMVVGKMPIAVVTTTTTMTVTTNGTAPSTSDKYQFICVGTQ